VEGYIGGRGTGIRLLKCSPRCRFILYKELADFAVRGKGGIKGKSREKAAIWQRFCQREVSEQRKAKVR